MNANCCGPMWNMWTAFLWNLQNVLLRAFTENQWREIIKMAHLEFEEFKKHLPAETIVQIEYAVISIFPFWLWRGRVIVTFDGQKYIRLLKRRLSKKRANEDAHEFGEWTSAEIQKMGFREVKKW